VDRQAIRQAAWKELEAIAWPDSRYHLDFSEFIPGYPGCEDIPRALADLPFYAGTGPVFVTPDGSTGPLRAFLLRQGRPLLTATHGGRRGFRFFCRGSVPFASTEFAATLDGAERFGEQISTVAGLRALGSLDFLVTGASAVSPDGNRYGKGHGYFDIEWGIFTALGMAGEDTPVAVCVHDCQVTAADLPPGPDDTAADWIITPELTRRAVRDRPRPSGIAWDRIRPDVVDANPVLRDLQDALKLRNRTRPVR
jgi:5-formyltetrahydrofolate cyclo-ligase